MLALIAKHPSADWLSLLNNGRRNLNYPDLKSPRTDDFVLIEILWSVGRSVKVRRKLLDELMETLARAGLERDNVMVVFKETAWENWAFGGGRLVHV